MGKRGPLPKPTALKVLEGNPGKRKIKDTGEPMPNVLDVIPDPPEWLMPDAVDEWNKLAPSLMALGLLTDVDLSAFATLCQNWGYLLALDKKILEGGLGPTKIYDAPSGDIKVHPLLKLRAQYYETWRKGLGDFGLTPASRAHLFLPPDGKKKVDAPMEDLLFGGGGY